MCGWPNMCVRTHLAIYEADRIVPPKFISYALGDRDMTKMHSPVCALIDVVREETTQVALAAQDHQFSPFKNSKQVKQ